MLRFLPALILAIPFYWMMGLRPDAIAFVTFLGVYSTFACVVSDHRMHSSTVQLGAAEAVCGLFLTSSSQNMDTVCMRHSLAMRGPTTVAQ